MEYTPSPWKSLNKLTGQDPFQSTRDIIYSPSEGYEVAELSGGNDNDRANFQLIATAPELLESAKQALLFLNGIGYSSGDVIDDLQSAIIKATS